jgi:hypothetical protein
MDRLLKVALLMLGIICLSLYGFLFWSDRIATTPEPAAAPPSPGRESVDLWDAYKRARMTASASTRDAQPVSASTQWQAATEDALLAGADQWSFGFYGPGDKKAIDVVVTPDSESLVNQTRVWDAPAILREGAWQKGPRDALLVFLARGGREFLEKHPQAVVSMHLASSEEAGPLWDVAAVTMSDRSLVAVRIDADTLEVLSTTSEIGEG